MPDNFPASAENTAVKPAVSRDDTDVSNNDALAMSVHLFEKAVVAYVTSPNPLTLLCLNKQAIPLLEAAPQRPWRLVATDIEPPLACDFTAIRVVCDRRLNNSEVARLSGCLAYALKATLATGEDALGNPYVAFAKAEGNADTDNVLTFTVLEYAYDARRSIRTEPDALAAFAAAGQYICEGTPVRTTDREGQGTRNTRLLEGLGSVCSVLFYVR